MKLFVICFFFFSINGEAQALTFSDLSKILRSDLDDAQDILLKKNFTYDLVKNIDSSQWYQFSQGRNEKDPSRAKRFLNFVIKAGIGPYISYQTYTVADFINIKDFVKSNGFKHRRTYTDNETGHLSVVYFKGNLNVTLSTGIVKSENHNFYEIVLYLDIDYVGKE